MKEPKWILEKVAYNIHAAQIAEHGGPNGIRDCALLSSAMEAPKNLWHYSTYTATLFDLAACYAYKICSNHPFIDGNKRTSYVVSRLFLLLNDYDCTAAEAERIYTFQDLAQKNLIEQDLATWFKANSKAIR